MSRSGVVWAVDIMQEAEKAFGTVGGLSFPADCPLEIEWNREDKETVVCGSTATLTVISPGDRTYEDLYTVEPGRIRMDVWRGGALYWSGALDPEFYEEPYERLKDYEVKLTFSDFGILDRLKYDLTGMVSIDDVVMRALVRSGMNYTGVDTSLISTRLPASETAGNGGLGGGAEGKKILGEGAVSVRSDNFTDEDGEVCTLLDAVEGVLQPMGVKMVQRGGVIYFYDLNGLYVSGSVDRIVWTGDSQTMGTDKVVNNVKVELSVYGDGELLTGDMKYRGKYDVSHVNIGGRDPEPLDGYGVYHSYYPDYGDLSRGHDVIDFTIFYGGKASGLASKGLQSEYFHILPIMGGCEAADGVAYAFRTGGHGSVSTGWPEWKIHESGVPMAWTDGRGGDVLTTERVFVPKAADGGKYMLRAEVEVLVDARYNPFSGSTEDNDEVNDNSLKIFSGWVFVPCVITLYDDGGKTLYHYKNVHIASGGVIGRLGGRSGEWVAGADPGGDCWMEYYSTEDQASEAGVRGWKTNRHCIGRPDGKGGRVKYSMNESFKKMADGEYLPYPPCAGYIEIQVREGLLGYDYEESCGWGSKESAWHRKDVYKNLRWCLYKAPRLTVVDNDLKMGTTELNDVCYHSRVNEWAKDELSIDTICGTSENTCPTAKGLYYVTALGVPLLEVERGGRTNHPERLLIGTLYSQYAERKTTLKGEAKIEPGLRLYSEANQSSKRFMLMGEVQDVLADCSEAEYCEIRPDEWEEEEEDG